MKTRNGFVSNSSSSSYIVTIKNCSWEDFIYEMKREVDVWWMSEVIQTVDKKKGHLEDSQKRRLSNDGLSKNPEANKALDSYQDRYEKELAEQIAEGEVLIKKYNDTKTVIKNSEELFKIDEDAIKFLFNVNGIKYSVNEKDVVLESFTSMHNSFVEGVTPLLQEIILYYCFEGSKQINYERDCDN